jgi:hypothetical protein
MKKDAVCTKAGTLIPGRCLRKKNCQEFFFRVELGKDKYQLRAGEGMGDELASFNRAGGDG